MRVQVVRAEEAPAVFVVSERDVEVSGSDPGPAPGATPTAVDPSPPASETDRWTTIPLPRHEVPEEHRASNEPPLRRRLASLDAVVIACGWLAAHVVYRAAGPIDDVVTLLAETACAVTVTLAAMVGVRLYQARVCVVRRVARRRIVLAAAVAPALSFGHHVWLGYEPSPMWFAVTMAGIAGGLLVGREIFEQWLGSSRVRGRYFRSVLVAGTPTEVARVVDLLVAHPETGCEVVGWLGDPSAPAASDGPDMAAVPWLGNVGDVRGALRLSDVTSVVVAPSVASGPDFHELVRDLQSTGTHVQLWTGLWSIDTRRLRAAPMAHEPFFYLEPAGAAVGKRWAKRAIDIVIASLVLLVLSPLVVAVAIAIKLYDRGPVFFRQVRVGYKGRHFRVHKFRTMAVDAEQRLAELQAQNERSGPLFKVSRDPRVTPIGRLLRVTSIDELPQLFDVLTGRLSLVGPRPALPDEVAEFDAELQRRHDVVPGVTGLWQVEARHNPNFAAYRRLDLFYVQNWTLGLDLVIMLATVKTLLTDTVREVSRALARRFHRDRVSVDAAIAGDISC